MKILLKAITINKVGKLVYETIRTYSINEMATALDTKNSHNYNLIYKDKSILGYVLDIVE